jgi:hypothetical protein
LPRKTIKWFFAQVTHYYQHKYYIPMKTITAFAKELGSKRNEKGTLRVAYEIIANPATLAQFRKDTAAGVNPGGYITDEGKLRIYDSKMPPFGFSHIPLYRTSEGKWGLSFNKLIEIKERGEQWDDQEGAKAEMKKLCKKWHLEAEELLAELKEEAAEAEEEEEAEEEKSPF